MDVVCANEKVRGMCGMDLDRGRHRLRLALQSTAPLRVTGEYNSAYADRVALRSALLPGGNSNCGCNARHGRRVGRRTRPRSHQ